MSNTTTAAMAAMDASAIDLRMYFTGLMVFTPQDEGRQALLVNARDPIDDEGFPDLRGIEKHLAVIQFAWDDAVGDRSAFGCFTDAFGEKKGYWLLDKDIVRLDPELETREQTLSFQSGKLAGGTPTDEDRCDLEWLAKVRSAGEQPGALKPDLTSRDSNLLAGAVELRKGTLQPAGFASEQGHYVVAQFPTGERRAFVSVMEYRATVKSRTVRLVSEKFGGGAGNRLELVPARNGGGRPTVEVWVLNREWGGIEQQIPASPVAIGKQNPEYLLYHRLLANPPDRSYLPINVGRVRGPLAPSLDPCRDAGMKRLYFPTGGGETSLGAPCSPSGFP